MISTRLNFTLALCWASLAFASGASAESAVNLRVGVGRADITPDKEVLNWVTGKPYGEVLDPIFVQALLLDDGSQRALVLRWDLTDVSESARDEVRQRVSAALRMPAGNILINASHNHSAPWAPVYKEGHRGRERDTWWAIRFMPIQNDEPHFKKWMEQLLERSVQAAQQAADSLQPVSMTVARVAAAELFINRRARFPAWGVEKPAEGRRAGPALIPSDPHVLGAGASFGPMDRTMTLVSFERADRQRVATFFHLSCHSVSIYPTNKALSADWPGAAAPKIAAALGGEALFLQGCAGDITPWRRGEEAVAEMAVILADKARAAAQHSARLVPGKLAVARAEIGLPLTPAAQERLQAEFVLAEIQVLVCGPLALVALPGEPLTDLGTYIRERSPYPQTLVLGYSNGNGGHYVGMPGEKARGGYEAGVAGAATDEAGLMMVETAVRLLRDLRAAETAQ